MSLDQSRKSGLESPLPQDCEAGTGVQTSLENGAQYQGGCAAGEIK
jgi:hypothetical protein